MKKTVRFGVSLDHHLLEDFDKWIGKKNYVNRSEAIRDLIRDHLVEQEWDENKETVGTISIVYAHEGGGPSHRDPRGEARKADGHHDGAADRLKARRLPDE